MRFVSPPICRGFLLGVALLISAFCAFAQESIPVPAAVGAEMVPDAPRPQISVTSDDGNGQKTSAQNQSAAQAGSDHPTSNQDLKTAIVSGTVTDENGDLVPGATVDLDGASPEDHRSVVANDNALFEFNNLKPGTPYHVTVSANGFVTWKSADLVLEAGQVEYLKDVKLTVLGSATTVTVSASNEQIAVQQVEIAEQQRVLGIVPNFFVIYDSKNAVPLTAKLKYKLSLRVSVDPIRVLAAAFLGGVNQAADTPDYGQGWKSYGQRVGAVWTDGFTDLMFGGAILPSLLHQDPRYYYQGTGTIKSRTLHALAYPFICTGDNGRLQPNYSTIGGDLISAAISDTYYPNKDRGFNLVLQNVLINTAERGASTLVQEFLLRKFTPSAKQTN
jgi:hypothetical protein